MLWPIVVGLPLAALVAVAVGWPICKMVDAYRDGLRPLAFAWGLAATWIVAGLCHAIYELSWIMVGM